MITNSVPGVTRVLWLLLVLFSLLHGSSAAQPVAVSAQPTSESHVPEGLAKSDWTSIRAAYEAGRHQFSKQEDGSHVARNPGLGWKMEFDALGFTAKPKDGAWEWGLELQRDADTPVCTSASEQEMSPSNTLQRRLTPAITEWFINDRRGLEQGWTLSSLAEIRLRVRGNLRPTVSPQSITFGDQITYSGLKAWDATGKVIPTYFEATAEGFAVRYDDAGAQYPLTIDPIAQQAYLKPAAVGTTQAGDAFGFSVAVSGDTVVVGAISEDGSSEGVNGPLNEGAVDSGAAYVFVRNGTTWSQQAYLKAHQVTAGDGFGISVAVSGDTVVVGAWFEDGNSTGVNGTVNESASAAGAAYVFVRSGTTWSQQAYLKASQITGDDQFGNSVAVAGDTVVVGAHFEDGSSTGVNGTVNEAASGAGAAYVFVRNGTTWSQQAYLKASQISVGDNFGESVTISGDTVAVGSIYEDGSATGVNGAVNEASIDSGAAYVFVRSGTNWSPQAYLKASQVTESDYFGYSLAISGDTLVVGANGEDGSATGVNGTENEAANSAGATYVFVRNGAAWSQQAYLKPSQVSTGDNFGFSVAISGDTVVVGALFEDSSAMGVNGAADELVGDSGAAYVFVRIGTSWSQQAYLKASQITGSDWFGNSVAIAGDTVIVGAPLEDGNATVVNGAVNESANDAGAANVFTGFGPPEISMEQPAATNLTDGGSTIDFGSAAVASVGSTKTFTIRNLGALGLTGLDVTKSGLHAADFVIDTTGMSSSLAPGASTTFTVTFSPSQAGGRSAAIQIASNDADENPFDIALTGSADLTASYASKSTVPVTSNGFTATGSTINLSLNYAPTTGDELLVVNNTSFEPINGTFSNLANGQAVTLTYGGVNYDFVAYYFGGEDFNDLVLLWKNRRVLSWGLNTYGRLGDNSTTQRNAPVAVNTAAGVSALDGKTVVSVALGESHSLALCSDGSVVAWGYNGFGQLGDDTLVDKYAPVAVNTAQGVSALYGKTVVQLAVGSGTSYALCSDGTVAAWGNDSLGSLGDDTNLSSSAAKVPVSVNTTNGVSALAGRKVRAISAGMDHAMAMCFDGSLVAWGTNSAGQLGDNTLTNRGVPVLVNTSQGVSALYGKTVKQIACGQTHNLALCSDGLVVSWGDYGNGKLGDNSDNIIRKVPVFVNTDSGLSALFGKVVTAIAASTSHSMALCDDGLYVGWGKNTNGRVGDSTTSGDRMVPVFVNASAGGSALIGKVGRTISAGDIHSLAIMSDGNLLAWGGNTNGQIGIGNTTSPQIPVVVSGGVLTFGEKFLAALSGKRAVHNLAIVATPPFVPIIGVEEIGPVALTDGGAATAFEAVTGQAGVSRSFTIRNTGPAPLTGLAITKDGSHAGDFTVGTLGATTLVAGANTTFTITFNPAGTGARNAAIHIASNAPGSSSSFDVNLSGTGGQAYTATYNSTADVPITSNGFLATASTISFTLNHAPVVGAELMVVKNTGLPFIQGTFSSLAQGQQVNLSYNGITYQFVADYYGGTGNDLVLVWKRNRILGWGNNQYGTIGDGTTTQRLIPTATVASGVLAGKTIIKVVAAAAQSLALCSDGTLAAWGENYFGDVGDGTNTPRREPVLVSTAQGSSALYGKRVVSIAASEVHSLALCSDGTVAAWGRNTSGQLGDGTQTDRNIPVAVNMVAGSALNGKSVVAIAAGQNCSFALCSDGTVASWGANGDGRLGDNSTTTRLLPVLVNAANGVSALFGKTVVQIAAGSQHGMALCSDGTLVAWGADNFGQLGDDSTSTNRISPVAVSTANGVSSLFSKTAVAIAAGSGHSLALCSDGTLSAWGYNNGALGDNGTSTSLLPVAVNAANGVSALFGRTVLSIAAGNYYSNALCADGSLTSWGDNNYGQLGNNSTTERLAAVLVSTTNLAPGEKFSRLYTGGTHHYSLAVVSSADPAMAVEMPALTMVADGTGVADLGAAAVSGGNLTQTFTIRNTGGSDLTDLVITKDGADAADFVLGSLGSTTVPAGGTTTFDVTFTPSRLGNHSAAIHIASNILGAANPYDITLLAAGAGGYTGGYASKNTVPISSNGFNATGSTINLSLNYAPTTGDELLVVNNTSFEPINGTFSNLANGQTVTLSYGGVDYDFVAYYYGGEGYNDLVLLWKNRRLVAWGYNDQGQLGDNSLLDRDAPINVNAASGTSALFGKTVVQLSVGNQHSLALCSDGTVLSWGNNTSGQLGDGSLARRTTAVVVSTANGLSALNGKTVVAVEAGNSSSYALCSDGTLVAWGANSDGKLGDNTTTNRSYAVAVNTQLGVSALAGKRVVAVSTGAAHTLALTADGKLVAWGNNNFGKLGDNTTSHRSVPVFVNTEEGVSSLFGRAIKQIEVGQVHNLVLCTDGSISAWGEYAEGQIGDNSNSSIRKVPVLVNTTQGVSALFGKTVRWISGGAGHSLALASDGIISAWGDNVFGEVGDTGAGGIRMVPVFVNASSQDSALNGIAALQVTGGQSHSLALLENGHLAAWGGDYSGQIGNGSLGQPTAPTLVDDNSLSYGERFIGALTGPTSNHNLAIVATPPFVPEIAVEEPVGNGLADGAASVVFGTATLGSGGVVKTFMIQNLGAAPLSGLAVSKDGVDAADFTLGTLGATTLAAGASTTFTVTFNPALPGDKTAAIHVTSNDADENTFDINLAGSGQGAFTATFSSASDTIITSPSFTATGSSVNLVLNFAPTPGTDLRIVNNTGLPFIQGTFSNLAQGQTVALPFGTAVYNFVANYYGGTGNDLVLVWAKNRLIGWGKNEHGQIGDGSISNTTPYGKLLPVTVDATGVLAGKTVLSVASGDHHSLAVLSDGTVAAWGRNAEGELGDNTLTERTTPVLVNTSNGVSALYGKYVVAVAAGDFHSLALCSDGTVAGWGFNQNGQIGDGSSIGGGQFRSTPRAVVASGALSGKTVVAISAGSGFSSALCSDGTVVTWGSNGNGSLGNNSTTRSNVPVAVDTSYGTSALFNKKVVKIAAGGGHMLVLCDDGTLAAWGWNQLGMLGDNSTTDRLVPVAVNIANGTSALFGKTVSDISAGYDHSLAACADGTLAAWGWNYEGPLGDNSSTQRIAPVAVSAAEGTSSLFGRIPTKVYAKQYHSLALCADGEIASWGKGQSGQLGNNSQSSQYTPVLVTKTALAVNEKISAVSHGGFSSHTLAIVASPPPPPTVTTLAATSITGTSAVLNGTINANGSGAAASFDHGISTGYGSNVAATPAVVTGDTDVAVTATLTGLQPGTQYFFRARGTDTVGSGLSFTTLSANADLAALTLSSGSLSPVFNAGTISYTASVGYRTYSLTVTPTKAQSNATITVNGVPVVSGAASGGIPLSVGPNVITAVVTAQDGTTTKTYTVTVTRAAAAPGDVLEDVVVNASNDVVTLMSQPDGKTIVGGGFTTFMGQTRNFLARLNADNTLDAGFAPNVQGNKVFATVLQPDGRIVIAGKFISVNGVTRNNIARLNADGTLDASYNPNLDNDVFSMLPMPDGRLLVGGWFSNVGGTARKYLAMLNADGTLDTSFNASLQGPDPQAYVMALARQPDGKLLIVGDFTSVGGTSRLNVARLNANGTLDTSFQADATGSVRNLIVQPDGKILLGGFFTQVAGQTRNYVARLNADGTLDGGFNPNANNYVFTMALQADGKVVLGGWFTSVGGTTRNRGARLNADGTLDSGFDPNFDDYTLASLIRPDGKVWMGGGFLNAAGLIRSRLLLLDNSTPTQSLAATAFDRVEWLRGVTSPEATEVFFEASNDAGATFRPLGWGQRISGGWELQGIGLPSSGLLRGRARIPGGQYGGSSGLVESVLTLSGLAVPDIAVFNGTTLTAPNERTDNTGTQSFGTADLASVNTVQTFSIRNDGTVALSGLALSIAGSHAGDFTLGSLGATTLAPGASTSFSVTFSPQGFGARNAVISLASNDFDETPFEIAVSGTGGNALAASFSAANTIPLTTNGFTASGSTVNLSLGFAPSPFSTLTVVNNTSVNPITGTFGNLAQAQTVTLSFGGNDYRYFADYFGGDGNDLVLVLQGPGVLDYSFNGSGKVVTAMGSGDGIGYDISLQDDGKLVVVGSAPNGANTDFSLTRYNTNGSLDTTFHETGKVLTPIGSSNDAAKGVAVEAGGKIVVAGFASNGSNNDFAIVRYNTDGSLDTSFGTGGKTITAIGSGDDDGWCLALQSDGKSLVAGRTFNGTNWDMAVVRYLANGVPDTSFSGDGIATFAIGSSHDEVWSLALQPDGKILLVGESYSASRAECAVLRCLSDGTLDSSFDSDGIVTTALASTSDYGYAVAVQPDGRIIVTGSSSNGTHDDFAVIRYNANGSLDTTFNGTGKIITSMGDGNDVATGVALNSDGKIFVGGHAFNGSHYDFVLACYLANGTLDTSFNGTGKMITAIGDTDALCNGLVIQTDGKVVLAGSTFNAGDLDHIVIRHLGETANTVAFTTSSNVPLNAKGFTAAGRTLSVTLGFTPIPGTRLRVLNNTSLQPIGCEFSDLAHGQTVTLNHSGTDYSFVANYFGGDGNDLTLEWANTKLAAFGDNQNGQLGITGTAAQANVPTQVVAAAPIYQKTILSMSAGEAHSLAVCSDGTVAAWGSNANGQLGNGTTTSGTTPLAVTMGGALNGKKVIAVAAGGQHSLALCSDGTLAAWGDGSFGQIGDGGVLDRPAPVLVSTAGALSGKRVISISAGANHSAALCSDGTVVCWGGNTNGELGDGSNTQSNVPVAVSVPLPNGVLLGRTAVEVACGQNHTLALLADGAVAAWGLNASGQLGNSSTTASNVPVLVSSGGVLNGKRVVEIAAGGGSSLARSSDGVLAAWGLNDSGQLGVNNATTSFTTPQTVLMSGVLSGKTVTGLFAGAKHAGALCSDGTLATWGEGTGGELGNNSVLDSLQPVLADTTIFGGTDVFVQTSSGASAGHSLALIGTAGNVPSIQVEENGVVLADSTTTGPGYGGLLIGSAVTKTFTVRNTGMQTLSGLSASLSGTGVAHYAVTIQPAASLAPGEATQVVVTFGPTSFGAKEAVLLVTNSTDPFNTKLTGTGDPELIATWLTGAEIPAEAVNFDAGGKEIIFNLGFAPPAGTTLMVLRNNSMGFIDGIFDSAEYGQLAQGQDVDLEYNGTFYSFVANYFGGDGNDLVLQWAGTRLLAWGANTNGSLGNGSSTNSSLPVSVNVNGVLSGKRLVAAACGLRHSLVLCSDGTLAAWGNNSAGQLGNGASPTAHSNVPVLVNMSGVLLGKTPIAIAAGNDFSLALCSDGTVAAWGLNTDGQLGNNSSTSSNVPVLVDTSGVLSGKIIIGIVAGSAHGLARGSDGALYAWGSNSNGQLGNNSLVGSQVPLLVNSGVLTGKQVLRIAAGYFHSLVTCTDGTQAAWGDNSYGMIGDGTPTASLVPVLTDTSGVLSGKTPVQQFGGQFHSVWMAADGTLAAWGRNNNAQLGISTATPYSLVPLAMPLTGAMSGRVPVFLAAGRQHHVALLDDGTLAAWGLGSSGQLGHGATPSNVANPVAVSTTSLQAGEKVMRVYSGTGALHNISLIAKPLTLPGGPPVASTNPATLVDKTTATLHALVNPNSLATDARFEYGLTSSYGTQTTLQTNIGSGSSSVNVTQNLTGLQPNTTYHYRVIATNGGGSVQGNDLTFTTLPDPPFATTGSVNVNNISNTTAILPGTVNPNNRETTIYFEFGLTDQYGNTTAPQNIAAGSSNVNVSAPVSGLTLGTTYHFRLVAQNAAGTASGDDLVFTTTSISAATLSLLTPDPITTTGAALKGTVNPNGALTNAWFEYGLTTSYTGITSVAGLGAVTSPQPVSLPVTSLSPATTYHYRLVAQNSAGTTQGADATFTTLPLPPEVETHAAAALSTTSARLNGKVNAQNGSAVVTFEWGTDGVNFPNSLTATPSPVTGSALTDVSVDLANLAQFTTYHYRVKAVSAGGTTTGSVLTFQPAIISGLTQQFPNAPLASNGSLTVSLAPTGLLSGWRFVGEHRWRASGDTATGLVHGSRVIEFRPVPGYLQPGTDTVNVTSAGQVADYEYYATPSAGTGGILVVLKPDTLAQASNVADRGQWRLLGETTWRDSATTASSLPAGSYLVECKAVSGYSTPVLVNIAVSSGQTVNPTIVYADAFSPTGTPPAVVSFSTVSTDSTKPYGYVGQIRSNSGVGTGFAVKSRVVATAAHVVFDEGSQSSVQGLQWLPQEDAGGHEPLPVTPRGYYLIDGYATQRATETPGSFSLASRQKDVAALYFIHDTDAARNGFAGFLASDLTNNEFLISSAQKMLVGYPVDGIATLDQGRLHATPAANLSFSGLTDRVFATTGIRSTGGNSGGPLCVQHTNGNWYPAAIYLGGATQSIVRAIDSTVIQLFDTAQQSGIDDQGYTGGGITHTGYTSGGTASTGALRVNITPAGTGWRPVGSTKAFTPSGISRAGLTPGTFSIEFTPLAGYQTPATQSVTVVAASTQTYSITYQASQTPQETWRQTFFGTTANTGNASDSADPDGDGFTNAQEYAAGTNPTFNGDFFKVTESQRTASTFSVSTAGKTGRTYTLQRSTNLTSWTNVTSQGPLANDAAVTMEDLAMPSDAAFYRIVVTGP